MLKLNRSAVVLVACAGAALPLASCASLGGGKKGDTAYVARDVNTLYAAAKYGIILSQPGNGAVSTR